MFPSRCCALLGSCDFGLLWSHQQSTLSLFGERLLSVLLVSVADIGTVSIVRLVGSNTTTFLICSGGGSLSSCELPQPMVDGVRGVVGVEGGLLGSSCWRTLVDSRLTHRLIHLLYEEAGVVRDVGCRWWFVFYENAKKCFIIIR